MTNGASNDLQGIFDSHSGKRVEKWAHYFEIYDRHFSKFRNTDVHIVEIGVSHGGSLQLWKEYFGAQAHIFGVDINPHCQALEEDQVRIFIGDQSDKEFLERLARDIPRIDILIDDGGHFFDQQINTFEILFPKISVNGVYLCEDLHTSYWRKGYGGGIGKRGTFIEYSKKLIDQLNAWHHGGDISEFTKSAHSMHFYDSILAIEKRPIQRPKVCSAGIETVPEYIAPLSFAKRGARKLRRILP